MQQTFSHTACPIAPGSSGSPEDKPCLLMVLPWLAVGGSDKFNLDLVQQMTQRGWEVSIATTLRGDNAWLPEFSRFTRDIFILDDALSSKDVPGLLSQWIGQRQPHVVMISQSELGYYLLPAWRGQFPETTFVDYCHLEDEHWMNGGFPRLSIDHRVDLDLTLVTSQHLKRWMVVRGADPGRVEVCTINVDPDDWSPDETLRESVRREFDLSEDTPVILYAGRLCPQKQPRVFARVMKSLRETKRDFLALVAGDGEEETGWRIFWAATACRIVSACWGRCPAGACVSSGWDCGYFLSSLPGGRALPSPFMKPWLAAWWSWVRMWEASGSW